MQIGVCSTESPIGTRSSSECCVDVSGAHAIGYS